MQSIRLFLKDDQVCYHTAHTDHCARYILQIRCNYIYVRTGGYTFIRKRTGNDIWKNLYEPVLMEADKDLSEDALAFEQKLFEVLGGTSWRFLKPVKRGVKHVLSHRVIHANFYELHLPDDFGTLEGYQRVAEEDLHKFPVSNLVYQFFSLILEPNNQKV